MTEESPGYEAGSPHPQHEWVDCLVRVPGDSDTASETDIQCQAKVRCDDVIDALDLGRWDAVAFQHLWRSAHSRTKRHELSCGLWYLKRAIGDHQAEARSVARVLRHLLELGETGGDDLRPILLKFIRDAEMAEFNAIDLIHRCTIDPA